MINLDEHSFCISSASIFSQYNSLQHHLTWSLRASIYEWLNFMRWGQENYLGQVASEVFRMSSDKLVINSYCVADMSPVWISFSEKQLNLSKYCPQRLKPGRDKSHKIEPSIDLHSMLSPMYLVSSDVKYETDKPSGTRKDVYFIKELIMLRRY